MQALHLAWPEMSYLVKRETKILELLDLKTNLLKTNIPLKTVPGRFIGTEFRLEDEER